MANYSLFMNGVYREVLDDICKVQEHLPDQILYLQPYSGQLIVKLAEEPPSVEYPVRMFISTTEKLAKVQYTCEIVGWDDKTTINSDRRSIIDRLIREFLPTEDGVYLHPDNANTECRNLIHVRRMKRLSLPFGVERLLKIGDHMPYSPNRATAGGWSYVENPDPDFLFEKVNGYRKHNDD